MLLSLALLGGALAGPALAGPALASPALASPPLTPRTPLPPMSLHAAELPGAPFLTHRLTVKLRDEVRGRASAGGLHSEAGVDLRAIQALAAAEGLRFRPLIALDPQVIEGLRARAQARSGREAADLQGMLIVEGPADSAGLVRIGAALQALPEVEYAWVEAMGAPPPGDIGTPTPDYSAQQGYLDADPGIGAWAAWEEGITGASVRITDIEYGWEVTHEDLVDKDLHLEEGQVVPAWVADYGWDEHGTAVMGQLTGLDNGYGVTGGAHGAEIATSPEYTDAAGSRRATAITNAAALSAPGDVILLEMQMVTRPGGSYGPAELDPNVWTVSQAAVDAGVVVVGAAGNGAEDLDSAWYATNYLAWGDSGAILVGAGSPDVLHDALYFSTYGDRVDLQGWGLDIVTLGYGDLARIDGDSDQQYTEAFGGTSGASPIVTVAAALVQDYANSRLGAPLDPATLRELLVATGRPQGSGGLIGPQPDVIAALDAIDADRDGLLSDQWGGSDDEGGGDSGGDGGSDGGSDGGGTDSGTDGGTDSGGTDGGGADGGGTDGGGARPDDDDEDKDGGCLGCSSGGPLAGPVGLGWALALLPLLASRRRSRRG